MILFQKITIKNLVSLELRWSKFYLASLNTFWSIVGKTIKESLFDDQNRNAFISEGMIKFHDNIALMTLFLKGILEAAGCHVDGMSHLFIYSASGVPKIKKSLKTEDIGVRPEWERDRKVQLCPEVVEALLSLRSLFKCIILKLKYRSQGCRSQGKGYNPFISLLGVLVSAVIFHFTLVFRKY